MVKENLYDSNILHYTSEEIKEIYSLIAPERDFKFDFAGVNLLIQRYLFKNKNELTCELPQEMFLILSMLLATPSFSYKPFSFEEKKKLIKEIYDAISSFKISLATPILMNLRRKDGNLASCFLGQVDDSLNGIMHSNNELAQISKNGGGVGLNISNIRANQSWVKGLKGKSNGIMSWVKIFNDTAVAVNQLGSRAGSVTVALDIWHLDIEEFLDCQKFTGDLRKKAYDIFPQIVIQDLFMKRVENNENWTLFDPYEIKQKFNINLVDLWGKEFDKQYQELEKSKLIAKLGNVELIQYNQNFDEIIQHFNKLKGT
jgi:ribonucleoside-diphosphate reductase alpha chain